MNGKILLRRNPQSLVSPVDFSNTDSESPEESDMEPTNPIAATTRSATKKTATNRATAERKFATPQACRRSEDVVLSDANLSSTPIQSNIECRSDPSAAAIAALPCSESGRVFE